MATILLQAAGAYLGGLFGSTAAAIGTAAGALAGYAIDKALARPHLPLWWLRDRLGLSDR